MGSLRHMPRYLPSVELQSILMIIQLSNLVISSSLKKALFCLILSHFALNYWVANINFARDNRFGLLISNKPTSSSAISEIRIITSIAFDPSLDSSEYN